MLHARLVTTLLVVSMAGVVAAQSHDEAPLRFEVASVKPNRSSSGGAMINSQPGGRYLVVNMPLSAIITSAFGIRSFQLVDVPAWAQSERFDITAVTGADGYPSVVQLRPAVQALLADRFKLQVGREQRSMQTYALVRVRPDVLGPRMRASDIDCTSPERRDPGLNPSGACGIRAVQGGELVGLGVPLTMLAISLGGTLNTIVADDTGHGTTSRFDFTLTWAPNIATTAGDLPDLFTAVREQLGLKLEPRRTPVDVVVIKSVERPTEN
jgi:uncharacterized protein (TIGR03435 family)